MTFALDVDGTAGPGAAGWLLLTSYVAACGLWSAVYAAIGILSGSLFAEPWQGVLTAVLLVVAITQLVSWTHRRRAPAT